MAEKSCGTGRILIVKRPPVEVVPAKPLPAGASGYFSGIEASQVPRVRRVHKLYLTEADYLADLPEGFEIDTNA